MPVRPIPEGFHTVTPYLIVDEAAKLLEFVKAAFDAEDCGCHKNPDGTIMHAQVKIGDSMVMVSDARPPYPAMPAMLHLYVKDVDAKYAAALKAGGTSMREPTDEFYGDRSCGVQGPGGCQWWIATHVEDVSPEEMQKRQQALAAQAIKG